MSNMPWVLHNLRKGLCYGVIIIFRGRNAGSENASRRGLRRRLVSARRQQRRLGGPLFQRRFAVIFWLSVFFINYVAMDCENNHQYSWHKGEVYLHATRDLPGTKTRTTFGMQCKLCNRPGGCCTTNSRKTTPNPHNGGTHVPKLGAADQGPRRDLGRC